MNMLRMMSAIALASTLLGGCATAPDTHSAYDDGVAAYRAKDYATARLEWRKAVATADFSAMNKLGYLLAQGLGGPPDQAGAIELWTTAAKNGHSEAAFHLANAYENGTGVPKSDVEAYAWYTCAAASARAAPAGDHTEADILAEIDDALSKLTAVLPPEHFAPAQKLAARYVQTYARK